MLEDFAHSTKTTFYSVINYMMICSFHSVQVTTPQPKNNLST